MEMKSKLRRTLTKVGAVRLSQICDKFRKPFNFCWKAGLAILAIVFTINLVEALVDTCKDHLGLTHYYWGDKDLGKNIEIRHFSNNQAATYNKITDERLSPKVRWISCVPERDSLTVFCDKEGKRGYLNVNTGKVVIDGQYKHAWHFSEGLAAVVADNGKVGFINYSNEMVIPAIYSDIEMISKDLLMAEVGDDDGNHVIFTTDGKNVLPSRIRPAHSHP
ncbi:MAG: WG repeat-containing protein [Bacteroidales bacterium]|nr:WG repeat-containing protein [Bacteroidales bacterium]